MRIRDLVCRLPWGARIVSAIETRRAVRKLKARAPSEIFSEIYRNNKWGGRQSVSGPGSDSTQTRVLVEALPKLFAEREIASVLDVPCGDFHWMQLIDFSGKEYVGGDIVEDLVRSNQHLYGSTNVRFRSLDLLRDDLPSADVVICRDCLVHLSNRDVREALRRIIASGSKYLLTTSFVDRASNSDIATGQWRPLNLMAPPYSFPEPLEVINEGCTEMQGRYSDKSMLLWRIEQLHEFAADGPNHP